MPSRFDLTYLWNSFLQIFSALPVTLFIAFFSMLMGLILGLAIAFIKIYRVPVLSQVATVYVSFFRGTPLLVQLFLVYYGLPWAILSIAGAISPNIDINVNTVDPIVYALLAFSVNMSAYLSETLRASIESVDRGQVEAANSIGLKPRQVMLRIVLPQAAINAIPNIGNALIGLVKDTSFAFVVMVIDVMGMAKILGARSLRFLEVYIAVSIIYWIVCLALEIGLKLVEKHLAAKRRGLVQ